MTTVLCRCTVPHHWDATTPCAGGAETVDEARAGSLARLEAALTDPGTVTEDIAGRTLPAEVEYIAVGRADAELAVAFLRVLVRGLHPADAIADLGAATPPHQTGPEPTVPEVREAQQRHHLRLDASRIERIAAGVEEGIEQSQPITQDQADHIARVLAGGHDPADCPWCDQAREPVPARDADPVLDALPEDTPEHVRQAFADRDLRAVVSSLGASLSTCADCRTAKNPCSAHQTKGPLA